MWTPSLVEREQGLVGMMVLGGTNRAPPGDACVLIIARMHGNNRLSTLRVVIIVMIRRTQDMLEMLLLQYSDEIN